MAPRNAKVKKAADVKVAETAMPLEGSGEYAKSSVANELPETDISNKVTIERKPKRGRKAAENGDETTEIIAPAAKKGKQNLKPSENGDKASEKQESPPTTDQEIKKNELVINGRPKNALSIDGKGKKKKAAIKKAESENYDTNKPNIRAKSRRAQPKTDQEKEGNTEKPKLLKTGRKKELTEEDVVRAEETVNKPIIEVNAGMKEAPTKPIIHNTPEKEDSTDEGNKIVDEIAEKVKSGRNKGQTRAVKDKKFEQEEDLTEVEKQNLVVEPGQHKVTKEEGLEAIEPKRQTTDPEKSKKETKGKRNQGKSALTKAEAGDKRDSQDNKLSPKKKSSKKDEKEKGNAKDESEVATEDVAEPILVKSKQGAKEADGPTENVAEPKLVNGKRGAKDPDAPIEDVAEPKLVKRKRRAKEADAPIEDIAEHKLVKGDAKDESEVPTEDVAEPKHVKNKRESKEADAPTEPQEISEGTGEPNKRKRKVTEQKGPSNIRNKKTLKKKIFKNKTSTNYETINFSNNSKNALGKEWNFKISAWNVGGIRAWMTKGGLDFINYEKPDILCLQEVKCSQDKLPEEIAKIPGYHAYWLSSVKEGYAGVGIYTTKPAMHLQYGLQNPELDDEGRIITAEFEKFILVNTYVVHAGKKLITLPKRLQWNEEFRRHVKELDKKKPVIICGDMNVAHDEIDLKNPKTNRKNAGFTDEERSGMSVLLGDGFVDTFRHLNPEKTGAYTFWAYIMKCRAKNVGWRLDYFIVSQRLLPIVCDSVIRSEVYGSDHCPISLFLNLTSAQGNPRHLNLSNILG